MEQRKKNLDEFCKPYKNPRRSPVGIIRAGIHGEIPGGIFGENMERID